ncbi:MAG: DNA-directed RNA polymerase subunit omega [Bryobacterales bacterium]
MNEDNSQALSQIEPEPLPSEDTKPPDMPFFIPNDEDQSVYRFILAAAKRARQLQSGARPTISTTSRKPTRIAMEEIRVGAVEVELLPEDWTPPEEEVIEEIAEAVVEESVQG